MIAARLFRREDERELEDWKPAVKRLRKNDLLWIDLQEPSEAEADEVADALDLGDLDRQRLFEPGEEASGVMVGEQVHLTARAVTFGDQGPHFTELDCVVSERWIVTAHDEPIEPLDEFRERAAGAGELGTLDGPSFAATLLEWVVRSYPRAFERIETELEEIDVSAMSGRVVNPERELDRLVELRSAVGEIRRTLAPHREIFAVLAHSELDLISSSGSAGRFSGLAGEVDSALESARDVREAIVGSFELQIARIGHRTNEIVKVLTLVTVILLPASAIAGVLGMNFEVGLFEHAWLFWVVIAAMVGIAAVVLALARGRRWI